jgi:hypothetical protein
MTEFHFLSFGPLARFARSIIAPAPGDAALGFSWAARYVNAFFAWTLAGDPGGERFVGADPAANGAPAGLLTMAVKPPLPPPPTLVEAKRIVAAGGVDSLARVIDGLRARDPAPLTHERIAEIFTWISFNRDPDWSGRERLARLRVSLYPRSARARLLLGMVLTDRGDTASATTALEESLQLLPDDDDPALDAPLRARIARDAKEALGRLNSRPRSG